MSKLPPIVVGALLASAFATAALAEKSDRAFIEEMRGQIATARSEPGVARQGASELAEAERRLPELAKALDDNEAEDARASRDGIKALIQAARIRAQVTSTPETRPASYSRPAPMPAKKTIHRVAYKHAQPTKGCTLASR